MATERLEVIDLVGQSAGLTFLQLTRTPRPALVVENEPAALREAVPAVAAVQVRVVEAWSPVDDDERRRGPTPARLVPDRGSGRFEGCARLRRRSRRIGQCKRHGEEGIG